MRRFAISVGRYAKLAYTFSVARMIPSPLLSAASWPLWMTRLGKWMVRHRKDLRPVEGRFPVLHYDYRRRYRLYQTVIRHLQGAERIDYLEFGVAGGDSLRWWLHHAPSEAKVSFYGFDTFTGLPEQFGLFGRGAFAPPAELHLATQSPQHQLTLLKGLFQETLPDFLRHWQRAERVVVHMDADLFTATLYVLMLLTPYLQDGDIIIFDEFAVPLHEFRAFSLWTQSCYLQPQIIASCNNCLQVAFSVTPGSHPG